MADRLPADETDDLWRFVRNTGALGHGERERAVLPDEHLETTRVTVGFGKSQELGPSSS
jgi:hypothetical protein